MADDAGTRIGEDESLKKIESLTKNLLECYEELDLIYRLKSQIS